MQKGDVKDTWSDISLIKRLNGFQPKINISQGIENFINWYRQYYKIDLLQAMNVLVTGGAGYIGSHVCVLSHNEVCKVTFFDNLSNSNITKVNFPKVLWLTKSHLKPLKI